ncbi:hypothetical protein TTHT_1182 [Thermotomaculum hydrothermale]|uniref:Uncharacterized protein n=1 Tax=Thermotomaculum hydrothermale TaxID=981385 RepID=A0A7R6PU49_9BACT|nr:hypothetical protein TTHT_1182 [Thermotomaculum hydrothermale]
MLILSVVLLFEAYLLYSTHKKYIDNKNEMVRREKEIKKELKRNEFYGIYKSGSSQFYDIPLRITDGKTKYIIILNLNTLRDRIFPCKCKNDFDLYGYSVFLTKLLEFNFPISVDKDMKKNLYKFCPVFVRYDYYKKLAKEWDKLSLDELLSKYTTYNKLYGYVWDYEKFKTPQKAISLQAYLFFKYRIFVSNIDCVKCIYVLEGNILKPRNK